MHAVLQERREMGERWQRSFGILCGLHGKTFTDHQKNRSDAAKAWEHHGTWNFLLLPDVTVWNPPTEHHEVKHTFVKPGGLIQYEWYRFKYLKDFAQRTKQRVYLTIHRYDLAGGYEEPKNDIQHWITASTEALDASGYTTAKRRVCVNGRWKDTLGIFFPITAFGRLADLWESPTLLV